MAAIRVQGAARASSSVGGSALQVGPCGSAARRRLSRGSDGRTGGRERRDRGTLRASWASSCPRRGAELGHGLPPPLTGEAQVGARAAAHAPGSGGALTTVEDRAERSAKPDREDPARADQRRRGVDSRSHGAVGGGHPPRVGHTTGHRKGAAVWPACACHCCGRPEVDGDEVRLRLGTGSGRGENEGHRDRAGRARAGSLTGGSGRLAKHPPNGANSGSRGYSSAALPMPVRDDTAAAHESKRRSLPHGRQAVAALASLFLVNGPVWPVLQLPPLRVELRADCSR